MACGLSVSVPSVDRLTACASVDKTKGLSRSDGVNSVS